MSEIHGDVYRGSLTARKGVAYIFESIRSQVFAELDVTNTQRTRSWICTTEPEVFLADLFPWPTTALPSEHHSVGWVGRSEILRNSLALGLPVEGV